MNALTFPLDPAVVQDGRISFDMLMKHPEYVARFVAADVQSRLVSQFLYATTGAKGGSIMFDRITGDTVTSEDKPGVIAPGAEFPNIGLNTGEPVVAKTVKRGGKFEVTREHQKRASIDVFERGIRKVSSVMALDIDRHAFAAIKEGLEKVDGTLSRESTGWVAAAKVANNAKTATTGEGAIVEDLLTAQSELENRQLGYRADTLLLNPIDAKNMKLALGVNSYKQMLDTFGLSLYTSPSLDAGEGYMMQAKTVGTMGVEDPISTDSEYVKSRQVHVFYTWASMAFGITDPLAVVKLTNLGA